MRALWTLFAALAFAAFAACSLDLSGDLPVGDDADADATVPPDAAEAASLAEADAPDAPDDDTGTDAGRDATKDSATDSGQDCGATQGTTGIANAFRSVGPKTIDGLLDDWGCQEPLPLTATTAAYKFPDGGSFVISAKVRFEYEANLLYFAAEVTDPVLRGNSGAAGLNDSVELYASGGASPSGLPGTYGLTDHHYVWDFHGLVQDYAGPTPVVPTGVSSTVVLTPAGYTVEASVVPNAFGKTMFLKTDSMSVDLQLNDADGVTQNFNLVWQLSTSTPCPCNEPVCCCGVPGDLPYCDTRRFGSLLFR